MLHRKPHQQYGSFSVTNPPFSSKETTSQNKQRPQGKDATLSLLVQEVLELKTRVKNQEQKIQMLKNQTAYENRATASTVNKLMSEYIDINTSFGVIKQEFDQNNNKTGLLALKTRLENIAKSIRYLIISQQDHEIHKNATNMTVYLEIEKK